MITLDSIDSSLHSIQIKDAGGDALEITAAGKINAIVEATDLDIRDLVFATDKVDVGGSVVALDAGTLAALENITVQNGAGAAAVNIQDGGNSITVDGTVSISGSVTVTATDLDIRDLTHVSDSVKVGDGTDFLAINADGSLNVQTVEAGYASWTVIQATVSTTESQLAVSALAGRLRVEIQNLGSNDIYIRQSTGVTTANGLKIPKGSSYEQSLDDGAAIFAIAGASTSDIRIAQYAA